jgi:hypothetical protein
MKKKKTGKQKAQVSEKVEVFGQPSRTMLADIITTRDKLKLFLSLVHWLCFF